MADKNGEPKDSAEGNNLENLRNLNRRQENQALFNKIAVAGIGLLFIIVAVLVVSLAYFLQTSHQEKDDQVQQFHCFAQEYDAEILRRHLVTLNGGCSCVGASCECCVTLPLIHKKVCAVLKYMRKDTEIEFAITIDGRTAITKTISVKDPVPLCVDIPILKSLANLCVELYNVKIENGFSACVRGVVKIAFFEMVKIKFGCLTIPFAENELMQETD